MVLPYGIFKVHTFTFLGLGFGLRAADIHKNARKTSYVLFIGELFQSLLRFIIVPVIVTTLVSRMACSTGLTIGPAGRRSVMFFLNTVFYAAGVGLFISGLIGPGHYGSGGGISAGDAKKTPQRVTMTADTVMDFLRNMFLPNAVLASIAQVSSYLASIPVPSLYFFCFFFQFFHVLYLLQIFIFGDRNFLRHILDDMSNDMFAVFTVSSERTPLTVCTVFWCICSTKQYCYRRLKSWRETRREIIPSPRLHRLPRPCKIIAQNLETRA